MTTTTNLYETATVQLDSSGNGVASMGPLSARETWSPNAAHVQCATADSEAVCSVYVGPSADSPSFRDWTVSGSSGDSSDRIAGTVRCPDKIWAVWEGGDPGAVATLNVSGTRDVI